MLARCYPVTLCLFAALFPVASHAQAGLESYDLSPYRVMSVHGDWRVICTPEGMGSWNRPRDCAVEDRRGLVAFVNDFGYFAFTLRGDLVGADETDRLLGPGQQDVDLTYVGPDTVIEFLQDYSVEIEGVAQATSLDGYAEAQARAIALMK